jgi:hypothetical protein
MTHTKARDYFPYTLHFPPFLIQVMVKENCQEHPVKTIKNFPPLKPKSTPSNLPVGGVFTLCSGTDRYGFVVNKVLEQGWTVVGQHNDWTVILRWCHTKEYWRIACCLNDYSKAANQRYHSYVRAGVYENYLDPHF